MIREIENLEQFYEAKVLVGGLVEKMSFFQMAPGSILSTQIPSYRSQYELYEVWFNKIDLIHTY